METKYFVQMVSSALMTVLQNWMCIKTSGCTKGYIYRVYVLLRWPEHVDRNQSLGNSKRADSEFIYCRIKVKRLFDCNNNQRLVE